MAILDGFVLVRLLGNQGRWPLGCDQLAQYPRKETRQC